MINLGSTSDFIVAALLAVGQLIEPVPADVVAKKTQELSQSRSCENFKKKQQEFKKKRCEKLRRNKRRFKKECGDLESEKNAFEVACFTDPVTPDVIAFKPRPLEQYYNISNEDLVKELHLICSAVSDRAFLDRKDWLAGKIADRDELASKMVVFKNPDLQDLASKILYEANSGQFLMDKANQVVLSLCHWKVNRDELAKKVDFRGGVKLLKEIIDDLPSGGELPKLKQANFILDRDGHRIGEVYDQEFTERDGKRYIKKVHRRRVVKIEDIPDQLFNAFIAIEDKRFMQHNGFDFETLKRLYYSGSQGGTQGGSTITMQIIKNAFFAKDVEKERSVGLRTLMRKIKEVLMITKVEGVIGKKGILTYYLNLIDLLPKAQGIKMAALDLFGKENLHDLEVQEMATLAALPKGSSLYNPRRFPERAKLRRDTVLKVMAQQGYITEKEKEEAQAKPMGLVLPQSLDRKRVMAEFYTGHLTNLFLNLKSQNLNDDRWVMGGLDIVAPLDSRLQQQVMKSMQEGLLSYEKKRGRYRYQPWIDEETGQIENIAELVKKFKGNWPRAVKSRLAAHPYPDTNWVIATKTEGGWGLIDGQVVKVAKADSAKYSRMKAFDMAVLEPITNSEGQVQSYQLASGSRVQGAAVVVDVMSGEVLAISGGFSTGPYAKFAQNNRATSIHSQPGSTVKPFSYLYALNKGIAPNRMLGNYAITFPEIPNCAYSWTPKNYSGGGGAMPLARALERSVNRSLMNLIVKVSDIPHSNTSATSLYGAEQKYVDQLYETFKGIYGLSAELGAYPPMTELSRRGLRNPCLPWIIGAYETSVINMAQAYGAISNGGLSRPATFLNQVLLKDQPLLVDQSGMKRFQVEQYRYALSQGLIEAPEAFGAIKSLRPEAVTQLRAIMEGIVSSGTAQRIKRWSGLVAGKTGTTNDNEDTWFVGFNSKIAVAVWVGYDNNEFYPNLGGGSTGSSVALPIFEKIMESYYKLNPEELENPLPRPEDTPGIYAQLVDFRSGRVLEDHYGNKCRKKTNSAKTYYFTDKNFEQNNKLTCNN